MQKPLKVEVLHRQILSFFIIIFLGISDKIDYMLFKMIPSIKNCFVVKVRLNPIFFILNGIHKKENVLCA